MKYKSRLCVRGDLQQFMKSFTETFAPVTDLPIVKLLLSTCTKGTLFRKLDFRLAYVPALIDREIYI